MKTKLLLAVSLILLICQSALAQDANTATDVKTNNDPDKLQPGVVASVGSAPKNASVNLSGKDVLSDNSGSPVSGSVRPLGSGQCVATLTNTSESKYSVSYDVIGYGNNDSMGSKRTYSVTLAPKKSTENRVPCEKGQSMAVVIKSGRKL